MILIDISYSHVLPRNYCDGYYQIYILYVDFDALYNAWYVFQVFFKVIT